MRFSIVAASVTLSLLQATACASAELPVVNHDLASDGAGTHQVTPRPHALTSGPVALGSSSDSEETPDTSAGEDSTSPVSIDDELHPLDAQKASHNSTAGPPGAILDPVSPTHLAAMIPGDMSSGKCMCPPPPSCGASSLPHNSSVHNPLIATPSGGAKGPITNGTHPSLPPAPPAEEDTSTSTASTIFGFAGSLTSVITLAFAAIAL